MKIFIVCSNLRFGGAERVAATLANGFHEKGHEVIISTNLFEKINYRLHDAIKVYKLVSTNSNNVKKWSSSVLLLRKQIKKHKPDAIIGIMPTCSLIAKLASCGLQIPIIATEHNSFERPSSAPFSKWRIFEKLYLNKLYPYITVLTEADRDLISKRFKNVAVMPNPLFITPITEPSKKEKVILAAGRVDDWHYKGFDVLIKAWSKIISNEQLEISNYDYSQDGKPSHWWLKIAGDGKKESFEYLMNLLPDAEWVFNDNDDDNDDDNKSGIWRSEKYRIEFLGFQKDMESLYKKSGIFVLSSRYEGFGLVLIEAMSQGCACVACDYKGRQREILSPLQGDSLKVNGYSDHGIEVTENGILCEPDDVDALAEAMTKMIIDDKYRESVSINAVERSKYYSLEKTTVRWEGLLDKIVNKQEGRS